MIVLLNKKEIDESLLKQGLVFNEMESRMNYGFIGNLVYNDKIVATIYPETFYSHDGMFSINTNVVILIASIQAEYTELDSSPKMKKFNIVYMDGYDEVRDIDTQEVIFSTILPVDLIQHVGRTLMKDDIIENVVNIWNKTGKIEDNLFSGGKVDGYLLDEGECTQDEREIIVESLYNHACNK